MRRRLMPGATALMGILVTLPGLGAAPGPLDKARVVRVDITGYVRSSILLQERNEQGKGIFRIAFFAEDTLLDYQNLPEGMYRYLVTTLSNALKGRAETPADRAACSRSVAVAWSEGDEPTARIGICLDSIRSSTQRHVDEWIRGVNHLKGF